MRTEKRTPTMAFCLVAWSLAGHPLSARHVRVGRAPVAMSSGYSESLPVVQPPARSGAATDDAGELERFFFDRIDVFVKASPGGAGALSSVMGRPAGGSGGDGGSVWIECDPALNTLTHLQGMRFVSGRGADANGRASGAFGKDAVLRVPPNCAITLRGTNESLGTLVAAGERLCVCVGGAGGKGNGLSGKPDRCTPPGGASSAWLTLQMTLVADVGLVGLPNAGKSTLLRAVSKARPKVANYPFTTLIPNLGVCEVERFQLDPGAFGMVWLDIPGLVEGAAAGKGLGLAFLRHTERCRILLHLIDGESADPAADLLAINRELAGYSPQLAATPQAVLLTKIDLPHVAEALPAKLDALTAAAAHGRVMGVSAADGTNVRDLIVRARGMLDRRERRRSAGPRSRVPVARHAEAAPIMPDASMTAERGGSGS